MKVTYNWLKDFVEIRITPKALADKLTMAGLEVTSLEGRSGDHIFEIEVTSNRADWLSVTGIAREVAAILGKRLILPAVKKMRLSASGREAPLALNIQNRKDCSLYTARVIRGVKVAPSPEWLKKRLELMGCRSVNNVVDITNYILFETGEPLHAFDLDKLDGNSIYVRRAKAGEKIVTIDGIERALDTDTLIIADAKKPVAVAGVMGGKDTEVAGPTTNILLEAAVFDPVLVRKARRSLGVQTESSYRFERGVNPEAAERASLRAAELVRELCGGDCVLAKRAGGALGKKKILALDLPSVNNDLGIKIPAAKAKSILKGLGFGVKARAKERFAVEVPAHRPDVNLEADLAEEIARIYGYENIPRTCAAIKPAVNLAEARDTVSLVKQVLVALGLNEVITYSLTDRELLKEFGVYDPAAAIEVLNPLSKEQEVLRPTLIPNLLVCVARNLNRKQEYVNIFELSRVFSRSEGAFREETALAVALCGERSLLLEAGLIKDPASPLHLKGIAETLFERLGIREYDFYSQGDSPTVSVTVHGEAIGLIRRFPRPLLDELDIKNKEVFTLEISIDKLLSYAHGARRYARLPLYPGISRDISIILKEGIAAGDLLKAVGEKGASLLKEVRVSDYYKGKQIPAGYKGLMLSCLYRSDERTLTEDEVNPVHSLVLGLLKERFKAQFR